MATDEHLSIFDELLPLRDDPEAFEAKKNEILEGAFERMPKELQRRMRLQQWSLDEQLARIKDPTQRYNKMVELFWEGFGRFHDALNGELPERTNATVTNISAWRQDDEPSDEQG